MTNALRKILHSWLPVILWLVVIFIFSSIPGVKTGFPDIIDFVLRKCAHMSEYFILAWLLSRALVVGQKNISSAKFILIFLICVVYAVTDEYHQTFVAFRQGALTDVGFDSLGALVGVILFRRNNCQKKKFIVK